MNPLSELSTRLRSYWVPQTEIRAEVWALGGRHLGRVLEGARQEARAPGLPRDRAILLQAVIRTQGRSGSPP